MDYPANFWDLSLPTLPTQLAPIDDSDFLSILSKQLNPTAAVPIQPQSAIQEASPPLSDESSPSPPAAANKGLAKNTADSSSSKKDNEMHKRKISDAISDDDDDDLEGQPQTKAQKEQSAKKGKRKSTGDETRAMKRKEQNRAAQRAFRERKEKHVKDLEEQVAALEAKGASQASENESLRELLSRLQNENLMLKQSAFTFNFPNATTPRGTPTTVQSTSRPSPSVSSPSDSLSKTNSSPSSAPVATPRDSPSANQQLGLNTASGSGAGGSGFSPLLSFSTAGNNNSSSNDTFMSPTDSSTPPLTFFSPPPTVNVPSPYTTIASNPMYTSYTDFNAWDQFFAETAMDQSLAGVLSPSQQNQNSDPSSSRPSVNNNGSGRMEDLFSSTNNFNELIPFSSFSPLNPVNSPLNGFNGLNSESPVDHSHFSTPAPSSAFTLESRQSKSNPSALQPRSSSPCGGADPDEAPLPGSAFHNLSPEEAAKLDDGTKCPKTAAELGKLIEGQPLATLGSFPSEEELKALKVQQVWASIKNHPQIQECDVDTLCAELKAKARCDGTLGDAPCEEIQKIVESAKAKKAERLQSEAQARVQEAVKQQQASLQGSATLPSIFSSPSASPATNLDMFAFQPFTMSRPSLQAPRQSIDSGSSASSLATPVSATSDQNQQPQMMDTSWMMNDIVMDMPSPTSQFLSYLNMNAVASDGFSPNSYLNLPEKE